MAHTSYMCVSFPVTPLGRYCCVHFARNGLLLENMSRSPPFQLSRFSTQTQILFCKTFTLVQFPPVINFHMHSVLASPALTRDPLITPAALGPHTLFETLLLPSAHILSKALTYHTLPPPPPRLSCLLILSFLIAAS